MAYFDADFIQFFKELEAKNNRDWFQANKKRYEARVKKPFASFVAELIDQLQPLDPRMLITPKDAIFRIYRDVRFSPDKAPYKNHVSANLSPGGRKDMLRPCIYLQFNHQSAAVYSGLYRLQAKEVQKEIARRVKKRAQDRTHIQRKTLTSSSKTLIENPATFRQLLIDKIGELMMLSLMKPQNSY